MADAPSMSPITLALYLGKLQLLLRQWEHFHGLLRRDIAQMPPPIREWYVGIFEQLLAVAAATAVPGPATEVWQLTETTLRQWVTRYRAALGQARPAIGDFQADKTRITRAVSQVLDTAFLGSQS